MLVCMSQRVQVRRLTGEEGAKLQRIVRRGGGKTMVSVVRYRRAMVVLASAGGNTVEVIARLVQTSPDRVREMIHRFNEMGMACLDPRWAGGRPRPTTTDDEAFIVETANAARLPRLAQPSQATRRFALAFAGNGRGSDPSASAAGDGRPESRRSPKRPELGRSTEQRATSVCRRALTSTPSLTGSPDSAVSSPDDAIDRQDELHICHLMPSEARERSWSRHPSPHLHPLRGRDGDRS
jgi:hypothetical protein